MRPRPYFSRRGRTSRPSESRILSRFLDVISVWPFRNSPIRPSLIPVSLWSRYRVQRLRWSPAAMAAGWFAWRPFLTEKRLPCPAEKDQENDRQNPLRSEVGTPVLEFGPMQDVQLFADVG